MAKNLTEKCKDLLGNIAIAIEEDLTQVFTVRRAEEHNNWRTAKYPVVFGYVASALSAVNHGLLDHVGQNAFRLTDEGRAAIAQPVSVATDAVTVADLPPFAPTETDYANAMKLIDQQAEQIAALTRERDAAKAEADALRRFYDFAQNLDLTGEMYRIVWEESNEVVAEYVQIIEGLKVTGVLAQADAALVAARQRADDGTRLTTADVRAQAEFAEEG